MLQPFKLSGKFSGVSAVACALFLSACGPSGDAPATPDEASAPETEAAATEEQPAEVRRERAEILEEYEAALADARKTEGNGSPALWTLADEDTTIYMFGTVHILRPDVEWRTPEFEAAFDSADTLVLELDMESDAGKQAMARDFMSRGMYGDGRTLSNEISEGDLAVLTDALQPLGIPMAALDPMEPWMVAVNLSVIKLQQDGFDPNSGVEQKLIAEAREDGKSFGFLETASVQASIFDTLPEPVQAEYLYETALTLEDTTTMLDQVIEEWADGDVKGLGILVANPDTSGGEGIYDALFLDRNTSWVPQIEAMLDEPGTVFIAVGAGHLAGPDSVITMLRDKGHEIEGP